jgi:hypothetical protein
MASNGATGTGALRRRKLPEGGVLVPQVPSPGVSIIFAAGQRPLADDVERALDAGSLADVDVRARVSFRPDHDEGWLELLASGLTFDLTGLAPTPGAALPPAGQRFALAATRTAGAIEAVSLVPGPHVSAGGALLPVVRVLCGLAARLALALPATAVCWQQAGTWMEPGYFARIIGAWLGGGAFPALGLTTLSPGSDGAVTSAGLAFFTGQELRLEARPGETAADTAKLAVRIIDALVRQGPVQDRDELRGPDGERLIAHPVEDGALLAVWREG